MNNFKADAVQKLFQIELNEARRRSIFQGIALGLLLSIILLSCFGFILWLNQERIAEMALDYIIKSYMSDLFATFPDAYVSNNQHKIIPILDDFTNAAAAKKVTEDEFKEIGKTLILALKDRKLTYHEIDDILSLMKRASKRGKYLNYN